MAHYVGKLAAALAERGFAGRFHLIQSAGGMASPATARRFPIRLLESGPAGGALAAAFVGRHAGHDDLLAFDMGGTTAKACLVQGGKPDVAPMMEAARVHRFKRGSGLPIKAPVIDMIEIGAGGGSIARVGPFGLPKVGPDSASSVPGPISYGMGGLDPTVTDADLVLGYLDPEFFLGGEMELAIEPARAALGALGESMGFSAEETAGAVHRVVNENMASAARMHAIERGRDIRKYTLVATGGAGPVHAWGVAKALGIRHIVLPPRAGVASAFGMLTAPTSFEFARSIPSVLAQTDWAEVREAIRLMLETGRRQLEESGVEETEVTVAADVRYQGQGDSVTVALGPELGDDPPRLLEKRFEEEYLRLYGSSPSNVEAEVLTWRLRISGPRPGPDIAARFGTGEALRGHRKMWFPNEGYVDGAVYDRYALAPGFEFSGPAVVEERESTMVIGPSGQARVTEQGNVEVEILD
jgi:5-oxoprolinase (ATP-hydrolysing)/N-methylhydantoinase A